MSRHALSPPVLMKLPVGRLRSLLMSRLMAFLIGIALLLPASLAERLLEPLF
jgi:hypothetical protein